MTGLHDQQQDWENPTVLSDLEDVADNFQLDNGESVQRQIKTKS